MGERLGRTGLVVVLVVVATCAGVAVGLLQRPTLPAGLAPAPTGPTPTAADVDVHVAGWVVSPGVVSVPEGSIVADAVAAAGGMRIGAAAETLNLAAPVSDGDQIVVPGPGVEGEVGAAGSPGAGGGLLSLNTATAEELQELPGVGPVLAERIVSHRDAVGRFEAVEDLLEVSGIGESKLAALRDLVRP
ncbi:MAG TPA: ComEA family DNA-binding protein [Acidimicrobiia bacterium]